MPSVQIKDVPEETHAVLRRRAAHAHQSLQEYVLAKLVEEASTPTLAEGLDRAGGRAGGSLSLLDAVKRRETTLIVVDASPLAPALPDDRPDGDRARDPVARGYSSSASPTARMTRRTTQ